MFTTKLCSHVIELICKAALKHVIYICYMTYLVYAHACEYWITWLLNIHTQTNSSNTTAFTFIYFLDPVLCLLSQPLLIPPPFYKNSSYGSCRSNLWVVIVGWESNISDERQRERKRCRNRSRFSTYCDTQVKDGGQWDWARFWSITGWNRE